MEDLFEALQKLHKPAPKPTVYVTSQQKSLVVEINKGEVSVKERT